MALLPNREPEKLAKIIVLGEVQGVFFRRSAKRKAEQIGIRGIVRNEPDGTVYIEAEGPELALNEFVDWVRQGPDSFKITGADVSYSEPKNYYGFEILTED